MVADHTRVLVIAVVADHTGVADHIPVAAASHCFDHADLHSAGSGMDFADEACFRCFQNAVVAVEEDLLALHHCSLG